MKGPGKPPVSVMPLEGVEAFNKFCFGKSVPIDRLALNERQKIVYKFTSLGLAPAQVAQRMNIPVQGVYDEISKIKHQGYIF